MILKWVIVSIISFINILKCQAEIYVIKFESQFYYVEYADAAAQFGPRLSDGGTIRGMLVEPNPPGGCNATLQPPPPNRNEIGKWVLLVPRYNNIKNCTFEQKVRYAQSAGYDAVIVYNIRSDELIPMAAGNGSGIFIPSVFVGESAGNDLKQYVDPNYFIVITGESPFNIQTHLLIPFAIVVGICFIIMVIFMIVKYIKDRRRQRRHRLPTSALNKIPTRKYQKGDPYDTCAICLEDYVEGEKLRILPCSHVYHTKCIDPWLTKNRRVCPICKRKVFARDEPHTHDSDSESESDDTTPLINNSSSSNRGTQGGTFATQTENPFNRAIRSISQQSGTVTSNLVTASDHHSINGDYESVDSWITQNDEESETGEVVAVQTSDEFRVNVHTADTISMSSSDYNVCV